jgi:molybdopterin biosynthesis enzyme
MINAQGLIVVPQETERVHEGENVTVHYFPGREIL